MGCEGDTSGDHKDDDSELLARFLNAECPRDEEDSDGGEGLDVAESINAATCRQGEHTLSI